MLVGRRGVKLRRRLGCSVWAKGRIEKRVLIDDLGCYSRLVDRLIHARRVSDNVSSRLLTVAVFSLEK